MEAILAESVRRGASDTHITAGLPPMIRVSGELMPLTNQILTPEDTEFLCKSMIDKSRQQYLSERGEIDFSYVVADYSRFRCNIYKQRGSFALAARTITNEIPTCEKLGLPAIFKELAERPRGLILVTGPTGSGKSTTLAAIVDYINKTSSRHVITIEDPIEYVYPHDKAMIHQREIGKDVRTFAGALRSALREDPDILLVGEMRDYETIQAAITAAETGHLVLSTLHTNSAAQTIERVIGSCPGDIQDQIRAQFANCITGVISQQLLPTADGESRTLATEIMIGTPAVRNLIREHKIAQIPATLMAGKKDGMHSLNEDLIRLIRSDMITKRTALNAAYDPIELSMSLGGSAAFNSMM